MARDTIASLRRERDAAVKATEDLKIKVREVALEYAEANGWCSEVERALEDAGIPMPKKKATVTIEVDDLGEWFRKWDYTLNRDDADNVSDLRDKVVALLTSDYHSALPDGVFVTATVSDA